MPTHLRPLYAALHLILMRVPSHSPPLWRLVFHWPQTSWNSSHCTQPHCTYQHGGLWTHETLTCLLPPLGGMHWLRSACLGWWWHNNPGSWRGQLVHTPPSVSHQRFLLWYLVSYKYLHKDLATYQHSCKWKCHYSIYSTHWSSGSWELFCIGCLQLVLRCRKSLLPAQMRSLWSLFHWPEEPKVVQQPKLQTDSLHW